MNLTAEENLTLAQVLALLERRGYDAEMLALETEMATDGMNLLLHPIAGDFPARLLVATAVHASLQALPDVYLDADLVTEPPYAYLRVFL